MKGTRGSSTAENILMIGGAVMTLIGASILTLGITNNNPNSVSTGAVTLVIGVAVMSIARKFF